MQKYLAAIFFVLISCAHTERPRGACRLVIMSSNGGRHSGIVLDLTQIECVEAARKQCERLGDNASASDCLCQWRILGAKTSTEKEQDTEKDLET